MVEHAVTSCVNDNMDLACAFVQKTTVDKALIEIDRHLMSVSPAYTYVGKIILCYARALLGIRDDINCSAHEA